MKEKIVGRAYVLGDNIDTDQIIPAEHLVYSLTDPAERANYGRFALSSVPAGARGLPQGDVPFVAEGKTRSEYSVVVGGKNFGCGSSREHAPFALREAGVLAVVAQSYARIFFRNSVDGGFYPPVECPERLCDLVRTGDEVEIDLTASRLTNRTTGRVHALKPLGGVLDILRAGDLFAYARANGLGN